MTDQRPQYGELATPEEQRRAAGLPPIGEVAITPPVAPTPMVVLQAQPEAVTPTRPHRVDRFATIVLLAYGLVNVVMTALSYFDLPAVLKDTMKMMGIEGEFTNYAQGRTWGVIAAIVLVLGWSLTAALSIRRLRRGRISWWLPLVGALVTTVIVTICISVPMMNDPAFQAYIEQMTAG